MSDNITSNAEGNANVVATTITAGSGTSNTLSVAAKTFTQEQVDKIVQERLARAKQSVPDDYEALKAKAAKLDEIEEANKSEFDKLTEQYAALQKEHEQLVHENERKAWAAEVSKEKGVPASVLRGDTREELEAHAQAILDSGLSHYGSTPDKGEANPVSVTKESILAIENDSERIAAIRQHLDLFTKQ